MHYSRGGNGIAPLSERRDRFCLHAMTNHRLMRGLQVGFIAGAMSAGALVGLGYRHAAASAPFEILGRAFTARFAGVLLSSGGATGIGVVLHFLWMLFWGICFALFASRLRGVALVVAGLLFAGFLGALSATIAPGALGAGTMAALSTPQTVFYLALLAASLSLGMRFARDEA